MGACMIPDEQASRNSIEGGAVTKVSTKHVQSSREDQTRYVLCRNEYRLGPSSITCIFNRLLLQPWFLPKLQGGLLAKQSGAVDHENWMESWKKLELTLR